jgi:hypothetical protein
MFTFKEAAYIGAALGIGFLTYKATGNNTTWAIPAGGIILVFGFLKPYGMSFIDFIRTVVADMLSPSCYINETDFEYNYDEFPELYGDDVTVPTVTSIQDENGKNKFSKAEMQKLIR